MNNDKEIGDNINLTQPSPSESQSGPRRKEDAHINNADLKDVLINNTELNDADELRFMGR